MAERMIGAAIYYTIVILGVIIVNTIIWGNWVEGRQQGCSYKKFKAWSWRLGRLGSDCYLLHYQKDSKLPKHTDRVGGKHYRLNITLLGKDTFTCKKQIIRSKRVNLFRADKFYHSLETHTKVLKLSFGIAILNKRK